MNDARVETLAARGLDMPKANTIQLDGPFRRGPARIWAFEKVFSFPEGYRFEYFGKFLWRRPPQESNHSYFEILVPRSTLLPDRMNWFGRDLHLVPDAVLSGNRLHRERRCARKHGANHSAMAEPDGDGFVADPLQASREGGVRCDPGSGDRTSRRASKASHMLI
jgi:hypothetical protein